MKQLTGLDAAFLAMETRTVFGHVGSVCILDLSTAARPLTLERVTSAIESRLPLVPVFRRRLLEVPFGLDQPYWVEDSDFDIEFHVRELALPRPGSDRQLAEQVARLHSRPLDRTRPLWEAYFITGLKGRRGALYTKVHHAAIDGMSGNDLLAALLDLSPDGRDVPAAPPVPAGRTPGQAELLARSAVSLVGHPVRAVRLSASLLRAAPALLAGALPRLRGAAGRAKDDRLTKDDRRTKDDRLTKDDRPTKDDRLTKDDQPLVTQPGLRAPRTPFNRAITQHRRWAFGDVSLDDVRRVKSAAGVTVNDVVMAVCAGALRRWLADHDALPAGPLIAAVPVSVRAAGEAATYGNRVSAMVAVLPTHLDEPVARLRATHQAMRAAKEQLDAIPADLLTDVTRFAMPALAGQAARLAARLRLLERIAPFNLFISNVPGPRVPLYYAGAELLCYYPLSAIADGQGLNITVLSYRDRLFFGLTACRELVPDVDRLAGYLREETEALVSAVA
jgi:diacylglycerol O-acyltransferase